MVIRLPLASLCTEVRKKKGTQYGRGVASHAPAAARSDRACRHHHKTHSLTHSLTQSVNHNDATIYRTRTTQQIGIATLDKASECTDVHDNIRNQHGRCLIIQHCNYSQLQCWSFGAY